MFLKKYIKELLATIVKSKNTKSNNSSKSNLLLVHFCSSFLSTEVQKVGSKVIPFAFYTKYIIKLI